MKAAWVARATAADRLGRGSSALIARITAWVRAGREAETEGWDASRGPLVRMIVLGVVSLIAVRAIATSPGLMWIICPLWLYKAWHAAPTQQEQETPDETPDEAPATPSLPDRDQLAGALREVANPHAQIVPLADYLGLPTGAVREALTAAGIPLTDGVRMKGRSVSSGVRATDIPHAPIPDPDPAPVVVAGQPPNNNANNTNPSPAQKWRTVEIVDGSRIHYDPSEAHRRHTLPKIRKGIDD